MSQSQINKFLSTFHFVLLISGYQLATSLLLPVTSNVEGISRTVTVPYRGFMLFIALLVILFNVKKKLLISFPLRILAFYWFILMLRIISDFYLRSDVFIYTSEKTRLWLYIFAIILLPTFAIIKSYKEINFHYAAIWIYCLTLLTLGLSFFSNDLMQTAGEQRVSMNAGLATISSGHLGASGIILTLYFLFYGSRKTILSYGFLSIGMLISTITLLRAGSRGPVLALMVVISLWVLAHSKHLIRNISILILLFLIVLLFFDNIQSLIGQISPIMQARLAREDHIGSRFLLYSEAFNIIRNNPLVGKQFALFPAPGYFIYCHNIILDSLIGMGVIGGISIIYLITIAFKYTYKLIESRNPDFWLGLLLIQRVIYNMVSSSIYFSELFTILLAIVIFKYRYVIINPNKI